MYEKQINAGLIFNQCPQLIAIASKAAKSDSDLLVKVARLVKNDLSITHDHQFFRKFRVQGYDTQLFTDYFGAEFIQKLESKLPTDDLSHICAWAVVKTTVAGFSERVDEAGVLSDYWEFIDAHCEVEHQFIRENYGSGSVESSRNYMFEWLLVENFDLQDPTKEQCAKYMIPMVMYWAALYELFLDEYTETDEYSILNKCLPTCEDHRGSMRMTPTSGVLLSNVKMGWAEESYNKTNIKWSKFYQDILTAQFHDPDLSVDNTNLHSLSEVDPDLSAIKKRFDRWRKGDHLSIDDVRRYIAILRVPYSQTAGMLTLDIILLVNLFTYIQLEISKQGIPLELIVSEFGRYPEFKGLVEKRYRDFIEKKSLMP